MARGLIFGRIGKGLFVYLNIETEFYKAYPVFLFGKANYTENDPLDTDAWTRFMEALLRRSGVIPPGMIVDARDEVDHRFMCHTLETDDGFQRYLLIQANDVLKGSLSSWGLEERAHEAIARYRSDEPASFGNGQGEITLRWTQAANEDAVLWVKRMIDEIPETPACHASDGIGLFPERWGRSSNEPAQKMKEPG